MFLIERIERSKGMLASANVVCIQHKSSLFSKVQIKVKDELSMDKGNKKNEIIDNMESPST